MRPGELVVATTGRSDTLHLAHAYKAGAIFTLCGLNDGDLDIASDTTSTINCRRCRVGAAEALRDTLHTLADLDVQVVTCEERIAYLRGALGGGD